MIDVTWCLDVIVGWQLCVWNNTWAKIESATYIGAGSGEYIWEI